MTREFVLHKEIPVKLKCYSTLMMVIAICLGTLVFGASSPAWAQQAAGSITGTVVDPSGSAVPNATVTVRDVDRGTVWTTKTSSAGLYNFPQVTQGNVVVSVDASGFSKEVRNAFVLSVNQVAEIDFKMQLGAVNSVVDVTAAPPLLQTVSTEVSSVLDSNAVGNLPMASRDINQLTLLVPGAISPNIFAFQSSQNTFGTGRPYVNGAREQDNNASLDGMDINQPDNNDAAYVAAPDAIGNFQVITSNAPADYGNYIGGVIVETTKSGTNHFHGTVYEYFRNTILNANTWQDKANAFLLIPDSNGDGGYTNGTTSPRPVLQWNNFGVAVGGPIVKDKLFFFADETTTINNTPRSALTNSIIPAAYLKGDLSNLCTSQGATFVDGVCSNQALQLYSPVYLTGPNAGQIAPVGSRQPFLNNQVPVNSTVAAAMIASPLFNEQFEQNPTYFTSGYVHSYQGDLKIDWQASPSDHINGRYTQAYTINESSNGTNVLTPNLTREYPLKNFVANWDHMITPSLVNEVRAGMQIFPANDQVYTNATNQNLPEVFGLPGVQGSILPQMSFGFGNVGSANGLEIFHDTTIEAEDSLTWTHGKHSIHGGFEYYHYIMNDIYAGNQGASGSFTFTGQYTSNGLVQGTKTAIAGSPFADFLLGLPQNVQQGEPFNFHLRNSLFAGFVQDNYTVSPRLTLNLGLRYELTTPRGDKDHNNNVNFDLLTGTPEIGTNYKTYTGITNFQPRVGFAWQPSWIPRMVVRGAYDISTYMEGNGVGNMAVVNPPNVELHSETNLTGAGLNYPATTLDEGYLPFESAACTPALLQEFAPECFASGQAHATNPNLRPAVDQQFSLAIQQQFAANSSITIGWVGNKDDHMSDIYLYNQKQINSVGQVVPGPYMQPIVNAGAQARYNASDGISRYNALELMFAQKQWHGLDFTASYTWSKCQANSLGYFGSYGDEEGAGESQTEAGQNFFQNEYDPKGDYGRCTIDVAQYFVAYGVYDLPFGRGKLIGTNVSRPVNAVIGGWKIAGDITMHSGFGITPFAGSYFSDQHPNSASTLTGSYEARPNCVAGVAANQPMQTVQIGSSIGRTNLNPGAVSEVADVADGGTFGNCQTGALRGPGLKTGDLNLTKMVYFTDTFNLAFSAQFINLTNTPIFSVPAAYGAAYSSCGACNAVRTTGPLGGGAGTVGTFGLVDGSNPGRQVEFSLRASF